MNLVEKIITKIRWLRQQPENVKVRYIWIASSVVVAVVALSWIGLFRQYERKASVDGKNELIKEGGKIIEDIGSKIKVPDLDVPLKKALLNTPQLSPGVSPEVSGTPDPFIESLKD